MSDCILYNADCLDIIPKLDSESVDVLITDPPYGIDFQSNMIPDKERRLKKIINDKTPFLYWLKPVYRIMKDKSCLIVFCRWDVQCEFIQKITEAGFKVKQEMIWDKQILGMGDLKGCPGSQHENMLFCTKGRYLLPGKRPVSVYSHRKILPRDLVHSNEKPIDLMSHLISDYSKEGDLIFDPFAGVAPVGIACKKLNRRYIGVEIEKSYCDILQKRMSKIKEKHET